MVKEYFIQLFRKVKKEKREYFIQFYKKVQKQKDEYFRYRTPEVVRDEIPFKILLEKMKQYDSLDGKIEITKDVGENVCSYYVSDKENGIGKIGVVDDKQVGFIHTIEFFEQWTTDDNGKEESNAPEVANKILESYDWDKPQGPVDKMIQDVASLDVDEIIKYSLIDRNKKDDMRLE